MKIEEQVTSLELGKKLRDLGVKQEGLFAYYRRGSYYIGNDFVKPGDPTLEHNIGTNVDFPYELVASAFTVAELGEMLRDSMEVPSFSSYPGNRGTWWCQSIPSDGVQYSEEAGTEADARAKMLIYLIENGHAKLE